MSTTTRILHFTPGFRLGGIETLLLNLYRNIDRDRFQFDFVTDNLEEMEEFKEIRSMGGRVYQFGRYLNNPLAYQRKFVNLISKMNPESTIFHSHDVLRSAPLLFACKHHGIKKRILHSHTDSFQGSPRRYVYRPISFMTCRLATHYFACSQKAGRFMFPGRHVSVFNNAIDLSSFTFDLGAREDLRSRLGISPRAIVIGHTGRFTFQKNHDWIVRVFSKFTELFKDSYLLLVGTGPLESETRRLAKDLQIGDRVIFSGQQNDLQSYLSAMDVFCFPSHFEGFGISLLESQTNGLRALVSDVVNDEICLTQAVTKLSLNASANKWASVLVTLNRMGRYDSFDQIKELQDSGYDMQTQWKRLIELYGLAL